MKKVILLLSILIYAFAGRSQETRTIRLKQEKLHSHPRNFYVTGVRDDRADTTTIGTVRAGFLSKASVSLNLPGGAATAIDQFLKANLVRDTQAIPVVIHIVQLEAGESTGGLKAESEVRLTVAFYINDNKIMEYKGSSSVQAGIDATRYIEESIRRCLDNVTGQFDDWLSTNKQQVMTTVNGSSVQVEVKLETVTDDSDRIAWSAGQPLVLDDFQGKVDELSRAGAATFSELDIKLNWQIQYGRTKLLVTIVPYFDKSRSWCRTANRTEKTLRHEQQHFNITAIKACELAAAIRSYHFTQENYAGELQQLYKQKEKEIQQEQELYDTETKHGLIAAEQDKWEKALSLRLKI